MAYNWSKDRQRILQEDPEVLYKFFELLENTKAKHGIYDKWHPQLRSDWVPNGGFGSMKVVTRCREAWSTWSRSDRRSWMGHSHLEKDLCTIMSFKLLGFPSLKNNWQRWVQGKLRSKNRSRKVNVFNMVKEQFWQLLSHLRRPRRQRMHWVVMRKKLLNQLHDAVESVEGLDTTLKRARIIFYSVNNFFQA
jgi:hypothetical protein